jgi:NAD(P)-dependent dehydrogenase (short-subunit alcohol dehydrogenase family)
MEQKIALVTGGNRGIGWQTALELSRAGVKVVIGARNEEQGHGHAPRKLFKAQGFPAYHCNQQRQRDYRGFNPDIQLGHWSIGFFEEQ